MDPEMHPLYTQGYLQALLDIEHILVGLVRDCKLYKIPFTADRATEFMAIIKDHRADMQMTAGVPYAGFIRIAWKDKIANKGKHLMNDGKAKDKCFEWFKPLRAKEVINALMEVL